MKAPTTAACIVIQGGVVVRRALMPLVVRIEVTVVVAVPAGRGRSLWVMHRPHLDRGYRNPSPAAAPGMARAALAASVTGRDVEDVVRLSPGRRLSCRAVLPAVAFVVTAAAHMTAAICETHSWVRLTVGVLPRRWNRRFPKQLGEWLAKQA